MTIKILRPHVGFVRYVFCFAILTHALGVGASPTPSPVPSPTPEDAPSTFPSVPQAQPLDDFSVSSWAPSESQVFSQDAQRPYVPSEPSQLSRKSTQQSFTTAPLKRVRTATSMGEASGSEPSPKKRRTKKTRAAQVQAAEHKGFSADVLGDKNLFASLKSACADATNEAVAHVVRFVREGGLLPCVDGFSYKEDQYPEGYDLYLNASYPLERYDLQKLLSAKRIAVLNSAHSFDTLFALSWLQEICFVNCESTQPLPNACKLKKVIFRVCDALPPLKDNAYLEEVEVSGPVSPHINNLTALKELALFMPAAARNGSESTLPFVWEGDLSLPKLRDLSLILTSPLPLDVRRMHLPALRVLRLEGVAKMTGVLSESLKASFPNLNDVRLVNYEGALVLEGDALESVSFTQKNPLTSGNTGGCMLTFKELPLLKELVLNGTLGDGETSLKTPPVIENMPRLDTLYTTHTLHLSALKNLSNLHTVCIEGVNQLTCFENLPNLRVAHIDYYGAFAPFTLRALPQLEEFTCRLFCGDALEQDSGSAEHHVVKTLFYNKTLIKQGVAFETLLPQLRIFYAIIGYASVDDLSHTPFADNQAAWLKASQIEKMPSLEDFKVYDALALSCVA